MRNVVVIAGALALSACAAKVRADAVAGGLLGTSASGGAEFAADQPLCLPVTFGFSGCVSPDATCAVTVDGGVVSLETSATVCSTGCSPGGVVPSATCRVPRLTPGSYRVMPFNQTLTVVTDGGGTGC